MPKTVSLDLISDLLLEFLPGFFQKLSAIALVEFGPSPLELSGLFDPFKKHKTLHLTSPFLPECFYLDVSHPVTLPLIDLSFILKKFNLFLHLLNLILLLFHEFLVLPCHVLNYIC